MNKVSEQTKRALYGAEKKNPNGVAVVVENGEPNEEEHTDFKQVSVKDITAEVLKSNKEYNPTTLNKESTIMSKEENKKFVTLIAYNSNIKHFTSKKSGKGFIKVILTHSKDGKKLDRKACTYYVLMSDRRISKKQKEGADWSWLWVFADEHFDVFRDRYVEEDKAWINAEKLKQIDVDTLRSMLGNK